MGKRDEGETGLTEIPTPGKNRIVYCENCKTVHIYSTDDEGLADEDDPFCPCSVCGHPHKEEVLRQPISSVVVV